MPQIEIHTTIPTSTFAGESVTDIVQRLFKEGLPKPIEDENFDPIDQPICYYAEGQHTQYGGGLPTGGKTKSKYSRWDADVLVVNFIKNENEIFIEKRNSTNCILYDYGETEANIDDNSEAWSIEPWFDVSGAKLFEIGKRQDVRLSDFNKLDDINVLFGFAVRDIKPEEITSIEYGIGDSMFKVEIKERFLPS